MTEQLKLGDRVRRNGTDGLPVAYMTEEFARLMSSRTNRVIALPVEYEYEVKD